ncbi:hypothetical protein DFH08DRAFT_915701 [Mycena albidolilacea]|uniref:AMP-dependent synthetase/ligase domain-containing protein n=1 Tax=Mycena albidolilacea TaxID=1033008 RepID=A0AAD7EMB1_9AGAR|nr:hypothetical protein DFH08DRAFT_915701 [Mycena albidolilacea]
MLQSSSVHGPTYNLPAMPESEEITTITYLEFNRATHRVANMLRPNRQGRDGEVVAIIAHSDTVLYHAIVAGLMTADLIPFPISPRNSLPGILQLLRTTSCHRIAATCSTLQPLLTEIKNHIAEVDSEFALEIQEVPSLLEAYPNLGAETENCPFHPYPTKASNASIDDIAMYIHSSGSTGLPRAVGETHRMFQQWIALRAMAVPPFHIFGLYYQFMQPIAGTCVAVYTPTGAIPGALPITPSADNILEHARITKCRSLVTVPVMLALWSESPAALKYLKTLDRIMFAGGPLPQRIGDDLVNQGLRLLTAYGATEFGSLSCIIPYEDDIKEWAWFRVSPLVKVRWAPQGGGTFECQILAWEHHTAVVDNLDDVKGYARPTCVVGRLDEVIMHSSGEKTVPGPMQDIIMSSPDIIGAVMFGRERPQAGVLIETTPELQIDVHDATQLDELRNKIWPIIEEANENAPAFSRIFKEMILIASADKPLPRAGKGTVQFKAAISLYAPEIESLYVYLQEPYSDL